MKHKDLVDLFSTYFNTDQLAELIDDKSMGRVLMIYNTIEPQEILRLFTPMKTATFYIDQEYRESVEDLGFETIEHDAETFKVTAKNVDPNALSICPDWGDIASILRATI